MYTVYLLKKYIYMDLKLNHINLWIGLYDIELLFVTYWWYKQSICSKNSQNCEEVKYFSQSFTIYEKNKLIK